MKQVEQDRRTYALQGCLAFVVAVVLGVAAGFINPLLGIAVFAIVLLWGARKAHANYMRE